MIKMGEWRMIMIILRDELDRVTTSGIHLMVRYPPFLLLNVQAVCHHSTAKRK
jgi:hypothetical protein